MQNNIINESKQVVRMLIKLNLKNTRNKLKQF